MIGVEIWEVLGSALKKEYYQPKRVVSFVSINLTCQVGKFFSLLFPFPPLQHQKGGKNGKEMKRKEKDQPDMHTMNNIHVVNVSVDYCINVSPEANAQAIYDQITKGLTHEYSSC